MRTSGTRRRRRSLQAARGALAAAAAAIACAAPSPQGEPGDRDGAALAVLRVGTSGDYAPFSVRSEGGGAARGLSGFDVEMARRFAADRGYRIEWVGFRWPDLLADLEAGRFDVAMSGVTVRPERSLAGRFTVPVAESGAVALVRGALPAATVADLDHADVRVVVNAGGHLERVARRHLRTARIDAIADNGAVRRTLIEGRADVAITDTLEAPHWLHGTEGISALPPFTRDRKAYLVRNDLADLARELDTWLLTAEREGTLTSLRRSHLGTGATAATAEPVRAMLAAVAERLALMPLVAEAKRSRGGGAAIEDPEREQRVIEAALEATNEAARELGVASPHPDAIRAIFRAQIEAAKLIQQRVLALPRDPATPRVDLEAELRPALIRLGDKIARLIVVVAARDANPGSG